MRIPNLTRRKFLIHSAGIGTLVLGERVWESRGRVRIGVVGLGTRGRTHLSALSRIPAACVTALCDVDHRQLAEVNSWGRLSTAPPIEYSNFNALLQNRDIDLVLLTVPLALRADMLRRAVAAGKHVVTDQPSVANLDEAVQLFGSASQREVLVRPISVNGSWDPEEVLSLLKCDHLGEPSQVSIHVVRNTLHWTSPQPAATLEELALATRLLHAKSASQVRTVSGSADLTRSDFSSLVTVNVDAGSPRTIRMEMRSAQLEKGLERITRLTLQASTGQTEVTIDTWRDREEQSIRDRSGTSLDDPWHATFASLARGREVWREAGHYSGLGCLVGYGIEQASKQGTLIFA